MPNLQLVANDLYNGVAHYLGYGEEADPLGTLALWDADQLADVKRTVNAGYRQFLYPPPVDDDKEPYEWSFLTPFSQLTFTAGSQFIALPLDFGGFVLGAVLQSSGTPDDFQHQRLEVISQERFEAIGGSTSLTSGTINYITVVRPEQSGVGESFYNLGVYPVPASDSVVRFRYMREPLMLDDTQTIPYGGDRHSETLMQSCLAAAELTMDDEHGIHWERFLHRLRFSIKIDKRENGNLIAESNWPVEESESEESTAQITYQELRRECGARANFGRDFKAWNHEQFKLIDFCVQQGYRRFWAPPVMEGQKQAHDWSFNKPIAELITEANIHIYELPADCGSIVEEYTYKGFLP
jgi:hypothetical protein